MAKRTVESMKSISVTRLKKRGYLDLWRENQGVFTRHNRGEKTWSMNALCDKDNQYLQLDFCTKPKDKESENHRLFVPLVTTPCNYGWERYWFQCPKCKQRAWVVYYSDISFQCRKCLDLCYDSQMESRFGRYWSKRIPGRWEEELASDIFHSIKYFYRNGRKARKYKRYLRLMKGCQDLHVACARWKQMMSW